HRPRPGHCFCQIPFDELEAMYRKRYVAGISTNDLLQAAKNAHEREVVCIVAMFELDDQAMAKMMGDVNLPEHHIIHCREQFRRRLKEKGA
ncbi:MAG: hypothetical protein R8K46_10355, partial [Mariprofundaceae bacterium]